MISHERREGVPTNCSDTLLTVGGGASTLAEVAYNDPWAALGRFVQGTAERLSDGLVQFGDRWP